MKFLEKIKNIFKKKTQKEGLKKALELGLITNEEILRLEAAPTEVVFTKAEKLLILKNRAEKEYENELKKQGLPLPSQRSHHRNH